MKTYSTLLFIVAAILLSGCKTKKIVSETSQIKETERPNPCDCEEIKDGKGVFRGYGIGRSVDHQESISEAVDNAHIALAQKLIVLANLTSEKYSQNLTLQTKGEFKSQWERQATLASKTFIANAKTICNKTFETSDNFFKTYTCIEVEPDAEKKYFENVIKNSASLSKLQYDAALYEKAHKEAIDEFTKEFEKKIGK